MEKEMLVAFVKWLAANDRCIAIQNNDAESDQYLVEDLNWEDDVEHFLHAWLWEKEKK